MAETTAASGGRDLTTSGLGLDFYGFGGGRNLVGWGHEGKAGGSGFHDIARALLQGGESAERYMLDAYRRQYQARLGGAAAGQRSFVDSQAAEMAGQGLSTDVARRLMANRRSQLLQGLAEAKGQSEFESGMSQAQLRQGYSQLLAQLGQANLNTALSERQAKRAQNASKTASLMGLGGAALGGLAGGIGMGLGFGMGLPSPSGPPPQAYAAANQGAYDTFQSGSGWGNWTY